MTVSLGDLTQCLGREAQTCKCMMTNNPRNLHKKKKKNQEQSSGWNRLQQLIDYLASDVPQEREVAQ